MCRVAGFQGSESLRVPGCQGSKVSGFHGRRFQGSRVPGSHGFRVPRFPGFQGFQGFQGFWVPGSQQGARCAVLQGSKVPGRVSGFQGSGAPRFQGSRVPGSRIQQGSRRAGLQGSKVAEGSKVSGFHGRRVPRFQGFQGSRVPGFQGSRVPRFQGSRVPFRILKAASPREPAPALEIETQQALLLGISLVESNS